MFSSSFRSRPSRGWIALVVLVLFGVGAGALSAMAQDRPDGDERTADRRASSGDGGERLERYREGEERRRAKRQSKEARAERRQSRTKYRDKSKREAVEVARAEQPVLIETPAHEPLNLDEGERVGRFVGDFGARIEGPGGTEVLDSTLPLRSDVGDGGVRLLDYSLEDRGAALVPDNPIVETEIAADVRGGLRVDDLGLRLETPSFAQAEVVEERAFFANALADTDLVVLPTPTGVQVSLQVRSADAPEQAVFPLALPPGAQARLTEDGGGSSAGEQLPPGSVEIVDGGEVLSTILAPLGWGADEEPLQASYSLEGEDLVVRYPHRSGDVLYPLAIDPVVADRFRVNEAGNPISNGAFPIGVSPDQAAWYFNEDNYGRPGGGFPRWPGNGRYDHNGALYIENRYDNSFYYSNDGYGQWIWQAPRQSFIRRADFNNVYYSPTFQNFPRAMCFLEGVYSVTRWNWETGTYTDTRGHTGTSPFIGGPAPNGSCSTHTNNGKAHDIPNPSPGNIAAFRLFAYGEGTKQNHSYAQMGGGAMFLDDNDVPSIGCAYSSPGGWVRSATLTTYVCTRDGPQSAPTNGGGLGIWVAGLYVPTENSPTGRTQLTRFADCQNRVSRCPEYNTFYFTYNTDDDLDPNTAGIQRVREGANLLDGDAYDILAKPTHFQAGSLRVDRTAPNGTIAGIGSGELARDRDYEITATSTDALSGSHRLQLTLDGAEKTRRDNCPATTNPCQLDWTLDGGDPSLTEGTHTLRAVATDQVGNSATVATRSFKVERTPPQFELDGTLLPTDTGWVAAGEQDLYVDAVDVESAVGTTGATYAEVQIDGAPVGPPTDQPCGEGNCELFAEFVKNTSELAEGEHTLTVIVRDGAGNEASQDVAFKLERTAPDLMLAGTLKAAEGQMLAQGQSYELVANATDSSEPTMQSGLGRIEFAVDDEGPEVREQPCALGSCPFSSTFTFAADENDPGPRTFTVTATDLAGNETTQQFSVNNPEPPPPECGPPPITPGSPSALSPVDPLVAEQLLRAALPEAFEQWSAVAFPSIVVKPELDGSDPAQFRAMGTVAPMRVDRDVSDGVTTTVETDMVPICTTPQPPNSDASEPSDVINETTALYANSAPGTDTLYRPSPVGSISILQLRDPQAPQQFEIDVDLQPGQELEALPNGNVAVIEPVPEGSEIVTSGIAPPDVPSTDQRRAALDDTRLYFGQATGALLRALEVVPDEIVAVVPRPFAFDALDQPVATSLSASGSTVTMRVEHNSLPPAAYPVVASRELILGDSLDEFEVLDAEANTADYDDGDLEEPQPSDGPPPAPPQADDAPDDDQPDGETTDNPSAFEDLDLEAGADEEEAVDIAQTDAAAARVPPLRADIALTESHPALLHSPRRATLGSIRVRPVVPWRVTQMLDNPRAGQRGADEARRARLWDSETTAGRPRGWFNIATSPTEGAKAPGEATDVALQFTQDRVNGRTVNTDVRAPRVVDYKRLVTRFVNRYKSVMRNSEGRRVGTFSPWNEPQFRRNHTAKDPIRAGRYWIAANQICHPKDGEFAGQNLCGQVVAADYSGTRKDLRIRFRGRMRSWQRIYENYLLDRGRRPRVWAFHNYDDANRYQRKLRGSSQWPITTRYYKRFRSDRFKLRDGTTPKTWLTATGVFYHRDCGRGPGDPGGPSEFYERNCEIDGGADKTTVLFGMRSQSNTLGAMMRHIADDLPSMGRLYYYALHDVVDASVYGGPSVVHGRIPRSTRRRAYDSGLVGSDDDQGYENRSTVARLKDPRHRSREARGFSDPNEPRFAFCALRDRTLKKNRPAKCPTN